MATTTETRPRPTGRTAVRAAVLDAAIALFAERGPASVSLRDIAGAANVNLGLLHRHFGSKAELVTAAIHHFRATSRAKVRAAMEGPDLATALVPLFRDDAALYPRLMAWSLLDNVDAESLQDSYPTVLALIAQLEAAGFEPALARARAAVIFGTVVGFVFYEPALRIAAELDTVSDPLVDETIANAIRALLELPA
jgi:AcrR family transcriptional regulator